MSDGAKSYEVELDWTTVVPLGDTLAITVSDGFDDRWVEAFEVVLDESERLASTREWGAIDFEYASGDEGRLVLLVKRIRPQAQAFELKRTADELVRIANTVAEVGTHVYELARELRMPPAGAPRGSTPPPAFDPLESELDADAA